MPSAEKRKKIFLNFDNYITCSEQHSEKTYVGQEWEDDGVICLAPNLKVTVWLQSPVLPGRENRQSCSLCTLSVSCNTYFGLINNQLEFCQWVQWGQDLPLVMARVAGPAAAAAAASADHAALVNWSIPGVAHRALNRQRWMANMTEWVRSVFIQLQVKLHLNVLREGFFHWETNIKAWECLSIVSVNWLRVGNVYLHSRQQCEAEIANCFKLA